MVLATAGIASTSSRSISDTASQPLTRQAARRAHRLEQRFGRSPFHDGRCSSSKPLSQSLFHRDRAGLSLQGSQVAIGARIDTRCPIASSSKVRLPRQATRAHDATLVPRIVELNRTRTAPSSAKLRPLCRVLPDCRSQPSAGLAPSGMNQQERKLREVGVPDPPCQPNAAELRQDFRPKGTFKDAIQTLGARVRIRRVMPRKSLR